MTKDVSSESEVRVLKSAGCPSVSGKSKLTYEIGLQRETDPVIRIAKNSGGGFFSDEWLPLAAIQKVLAGRGAEKGLTSNAFRATYQGKSVNTAGFLVAVLKAEGVLRPREGNARLCEVADWDGFVNDIQALIRAPAGGGEAGKRGATAASKKTAYKAKAR
jgi:hypothetical protein